jgi:hypothetical protein
MEPTAYIRKHRERISASEAQPATKTSAIMPSGTDDSSKNCPDPERGLGQLDLRLCALIFVLEDYGSSSRSHPLVQHGQMPGYYQHWSLLKTRPPPDSRMAAICNI